MAAACCTAEKRVETPIRRESSFRVRDLGKMVFGARTSVAANRVMMDTKKVRGLLLKLNEALHRGIQLDSVHPYYTETSHFCNNLVMKY
jgi:hypothetical protein